MVGGRPYASKITRRVIAADIPEASRSAPEWGVQPPRVLNKSVSGLASCLFLICERAISAPHRGLFNTLLHWTTVVYVGNSGIGDGAALASQVVKDCGSRVEVAPGEPEGVESGQLYHLRPGQPTLARHTREAPDQRLPVSWSPSRRSPSTASTSSNVKGSSPTVRSNATAVRLRSSKTMRTCRPPSVSCTTGRCLSSLNGYAFTPRQPPALRRMSWAKVGCRSGTPQHALGAGGVVIGVGVARVATLLVEHMRVGAGDTPLAPGGLRGR